MTQTLQKTVLIGVSGGIAAYKSANLVRLFQKSGYRVKVVMTEHATHFVDPTTFRALTHEPVGLGLFDDPSDPIHHISLAQEADLFVIAPATANIIAKMAQGIADDLLTTTYLACTAPKVIAPAMNVHMYEAPATQRNINQLLQDGCHIVEAGSGFLACGYEGRGRMAQEEEIFKACHKILSAAMPLQGKRILITGGPTREAIDPVRFISNHSSGKMAYALASQAALQGAQVELVSGPVSLDCPYGVNRSWVVSARDMMECAQEKSQDADIIICAAAVADMRPCTPVDQKLKKGQDEDSLSILRLTENPDILATLSRKRKPGQLIVGFAAETNDVISYAQAKLAKKACDLIIANEVGAGKVFGQDKNKAYFVTEKQVEELPLLHKTDLARRILDKIVNMQEEF